MTSLPPKKVAVRATNWLGDVILSLPALRDLGRAMPETRLTVLARPSVAPLYEAVREVSEVVSVDGVLSQTAALRDGKYDRVIFFTNSFGTALAGALAGVPERWGYSTQGRSLLLTKSAAVPSNVLGRSQVHYYSSMLAAMGIPTSESLDTSFAPPSAWVERGRALLGPGRYVGLAPGAAKGPAKRWSPERFAAAGDLLRRELGVEIVLLGAPTDAHAARAVAEALKEGSALDLCGRTDLRTFAGVLSTLEGLVANDSGAMHLGAAVGIPTIGVFGPTNPDQTHPVGPRASFVRGFDTEAGPVAAALLKEMRR
jgi:heptosyltransferase II